MARGWNYTRLLECPSPIFSWDVLSVIVPFHLSCFCFILFSCSRWRCVDVPMILSCPVDHVQYRADNYE